MVTPAAEVGKQVIGGLIGGTHSGRISEAKLGIKADTAALKALRTEFDQLRATIKSVGREFDELTRKADKARGSISSAATVSAGRAQNGMPLPPPAPGTSPTPGPGSPMAGGSWGRIPAALRSGGGGGGLPTGGGGAGGAGGSAGGGIGGAAGAAVIAAAVSAAVSKGLSALNNRIETGRQYALSADRLNVLLQQQTGMSQLEIMQNVRQPLANYRIGNPNEVLNFASQYGEWGALRMGSSWEAMRAMTGWSKSTADVITDYRALMQPDVANQLFRFTGVSPFQMGGGMQDPIRFYQQLTQRLGLTNEATVRGSLGIGSFMRGNLAQMGLGEQQQNDLLTYAQENLTFQRRGGTGMYDPGNREHQRIMGIDRNFATKSEETAQTTIRGEEQFMERQIDNLAAMEDNTQALIKLKTALEDFMSGPIGAWAELNTSLGGRIGQAIGAPLGIGPLGGVIGGGIHRGITKFGGLFGDAPSGSSTVGSGPQGGAGATSSANDANIAVPVGYGGGKATLNELKNRHDFRKLDPKMQERLLRMFRENPNVGFGGGYRDPAQQEQLFRSRYRPTNKKTKTFWQGQYWEHVSGAPAAPPGRSFHQVGLAADLVGDLDWMNANAARFGLKHFANVNNEPWHVQPVETPNGWSEWERQGGRAALDMGGEETPPDTRPVTGAVAEEHGSGGQVLGGGNPLSSFSGMTISQAVEAMAQSVAGFSGSFAAPARRRSGATGIDQPTVIGSGASVPAGGALSGEEVARILYNAGFRGQDLIEMVAITRRESGWNPRAYNGNLSTGDQSYGLAQINTLNGPGGRMGDYVKQILRDMGLPEDFNQLYDPAINAAVAYRFYKDNGNTLHAWGGYKGKSNTYNTNVAEAATIVRNAGLGDPFDSAPAPAQPAQISAAPHVSHHIEMHVPVTVQVHASGNAQVDVERIASEVAERIERATREGMARTR